MMRFKNFLVWPLSILVVGLLAGAGAGLLSLFLDLVEHFFLSFEESAAHPAAVNVTSLQRLISVLLGGCIVALVWYVIRKQKQIPTISETMQDDRMPFFATALHVFAQIFYVGTGGSVGRELAPREFGALLAQKWNDCLHWLGLPEFSGEDKALFIAAAAGAGFAGAYIAPITGMFFCIEILHKKLKVRPVAVSLSMSILAMLVGGWIKGTQAYYHVGSQKFSLLLLALVLLIAPICGLIGAYFRKTLLWAEAHQSRGKQILWLLPLSALVTGLIALAYPQIFGNGRALAQLAMNSSSSSQQIIPVLLLLAILKGPVTILTIRAGASGGTLTPSIAMGASLGAIVCLLIPGFPVWQGAVVGACALLASAQQAPLMALFMLIEVSHLPINSVIPLGMGVAIAMAVSQLILKQPVERLGLSDE